MLAVALALLPAGARLASQPHDVRLRALAERYDAILGNPTGGVLEEYEARLDLVQALRAVEPTRLDRDDRVDFRLLEAMLRRDLYWLMGEDLDGRLPLPGFLYRRVYDASLDRDGLVEALVQDLEALGSILEAGGEGLGERRGDRRRRLLLLRRVLKDRLPVVIAYAGERKAALRRLATRLERQVRVLRRKALRPPTSDERSRRSGVGPKRFRFLLNRFHLVPLEPSALEAIGRQMARRTEVELTRLARRIDPERTWKEIARDLGDLHPPLGELPRVAQAELERSIRFVEERDLVTLPPAARRIRTRPWPEIWNYPFGAYLRAEGPEDFAHYAVPDLTQDGLDDTERETRLRENNIYWTRVVAVHEGVPGHHLQFTVAAGNPNPVRRRYYSHVYGEGWALYCEELMFRHGYYPDLRTRLAQLKMRLWRSLRVVIDVGLHCREMPRGWAEDLLVERVGLTRVGAEAEVNRYLQNPTRPSSYVLGYLMLTELREELEARQGDAFDEKAFHDRLLRMGPIPLTLARELLRAESR